MDNSRAENKARRFSDRLVYVISTPDGRQHELLYARKGNLRAILTYESRTQTMLTLDPGSDTITLTR